MGATQGLDPRYTAALVRGMIAMKKVASAEGGAISPARAAQVLGRYTGEICPFYTCS
jgi:hypothetical protein